MQHATAPAPAAAPTTTTVEQLSKPQRKLAARQAVRPLLQRMPPGWQGWSVERLEQFKDDAALIQGSGGSCDDLEAAAGRIRLAFGDRP